MKSFTNTIEAAVGIEPTHKRFASPLRSHFATPPRIVENEGGEADGC